jgi:UDP-N-acetylmuramoyl-tripeptide--D-alanyl-D-alanine ligase
MSLWSWSELCRAVNAQQILGDSEPVVQGVSIDTRSLQPGDLFIALTGDPGPEFRGNSPVAGARDGHQFIRQAEAAGAAAALVHQVVDSALPLLVVEDTLDAMWNLARESIRRSPAKRVAITGSSGKTTARAFLQKVLSDQGPTHASIGSLNNHWGVPLSIARMPADSLYGIFEIGMNHPGEIEPLAKLTRPEVALVLNVYPAHIGAFGDLDGIRREKFSIAGGLTDNGTLVLPDTLEAWAESPNRLTFGYSTTADVRLLELQRRQDHPLGLRVSISINGQKHEFLTVWGGEHRVMTCLAVLGVVHALGADLAAACQSLEQVQPPEGRGNHWLINGIGLTDDSYNANPASMGYALANLVAATDGGAGRRTIAILGDMLELGIESGQLHEGLLEHLDQVDKIIAVGPQMELLYNLLPPDKRWFWVASADAIDMDSLAGSLEPGDQVLVKGSNRIFWTNHFVSRLVSTLRHLA